ncbi:DUF1153 domain-containing protein [Altererythrobacter sp.]|uniref:DUF1153 domain-containing protein n=1 Tax=Altererythrobacter sp. TaxID=1872480 RepID=UPI003D150F8B
MADAIKRAGLPESHDIHWSDARKADVVRAVRNKLISFDEARWRYLLSRKEFESWEEQVDEKTGHKSIRLQSVPPVERRRESADEEQPRERPRLASV